MSGIKNVDKDELTSNIIKRAIYFLLKLHTIQLCLLIILLSLYLASLHFFQCVVIGLIFGQLRCLRYSLQEVDIQYKLSIAMVEKPQNHSLYKKLKVIACQHQICIQLHEHMISVTTVIFFCATAVIMIHLVFDGAAMVILFDYDKYGAARMFTAYSASWVAFLAMCIPSQLISNASNDLFNESYCIDWYTHPPKSRIILIFMMMNAMKTLVVRAGPLLDMNFESFSNVMKRSISFVTAFRSLYALYQEKERE